MTPLEELERIAKAERLVIAYKHAIHRMKGHAIAIRQDALEESIGIIENHKALLDCMEQMRAALETCCGGEQKDPYYDTYLVHQALSTYAKLKG